MNRGVIIILTRIEYNVRVLFVLDVVVVVAAAAISGKDNVQSHRRKQIGRVFWSKQGRFT